MSEDRRIGAWFLGWMVGLPFIVYLFSPEVLLYLRVVGAVDSWDSWMWSAWTGIGLLVVFILSFMTVRIWCAPVSVWYVALAGIAVHLLLLPVRVAVRYLPPQTNYGLAEGRLAYIIGASPFGAAGRYSEGVLPMLAPYAFAAVGYLIAMALGCWLGGIGREAEGESRRLGVWFLGWMVGLPVLSYVFSPEALLFVARVFKIPGFRGIYFVVIALGLAVAFVLSLLAVRRWRAPTSLWYVPLAGLLVSVVLPPIRIMAQIVARFDGLVAPRTIQLPLWNIAGVTPFGPAGLESPSISDMLIPYAFAMIGYLLAVSLGCWFAARRAHATNASG
ncbi:MAG: hypothetical protein U1E29_10520 [Coriobacteriia bacterium]|nr:hypothetical protein [Coriobacteriia bacterium]